MRKITELSLLSRELIELPCSMTLATESFREGWNFVRSVNAHRLKKQIHASGWNFIKIAEGSLRSGVGDTSQEAIANALRLALRHIRTQFNAAEVEHIELTRYPWFCLARVSICPYCIQESAVLPLSDECLAPPHPRQRRLSPQASALYPHFGSAMPQLKQMLTSARSAQGRAQ